MGGTRVPIIQGNFDQMFGVEALKDRLDHEANVRGMLTKAQSTVTAFRQIAAEHEAHRGRVDRWNRVFDTFARLGPLGTSYGALDFDSKVTPERSAELAAQRHASDRERRENKLETQVDLLARHVRLYADATSIDAARDFLDAKLAGLSGIDGLPSPAVVREAVLAKLTDYDGTPVDSESLPPELRDIQTGMMQGAEERFDRALGKYVDTYGETTGMLDLQYEKGQHLVNAFVTGASTVGFGFIEAPQIIAEMGLNALNIGKDNGQVWTRKHVSAMREAITELFPQDVDRQEDFSTLLASGGGSYLAFMLGAWALGPSAAAVLGASTTGTELYRDAEAHGGTFIQKFVAFTLGSGIGLSEALPIANMFARASRGVGHNVFMNLVVNSTASSMEEFLQEFGQELGEDAVAKWFAGYDPKREIAFADYLRAGAVGGILGAGGGVVTTGAAVYADTNARQQLDALSATLMASREAFLGAQMRLDARLRAPATVSGGMTAIPSTALSGAPATGFGPLARPAAPIATPGFVMRETTGRVHVDETVEEDALLPTAGEAMAAGLRPGDVTSAPFLEWFGDSTVADETGDPLVAYHATRSEIEVFWPMSHFGTVRAASQRLDAEERWTAGAINPTDENIIPVYLSIQRPLDLGPEGSTPSTGGKSWDTISDTFMQIADVLRAEQGPVRASADVIERFYEIAGYFSDNEIEIANEPALDLLEEAAALLEDLGYDGLRYTNEIEDAGSISYVPLRPTQIKSVFNRGTWDQADPNIDAQAAYHGSPYRFNAFSTRNIGTGEGAQAFGWGLYFASRKGIADHYRRKLTGRGPKVTFTSDAVSPIYHWSDAPFRAGTIRRAEIRAGREASEQTFFAVQTALEQASQTGLMPDAESIAMEMRNLYMEVLTSPELVARDLDRETWLVAPAREALAILERYGMAIRPEGEGFLYEVNLPGDDALMNWDAPFAEQPETVKDALRDLMLEAFGDEFVDPDTKTDPLEKGIAEERAAALDQEPVKNIYERIAARLANQARVGSAYGGAYNAGAKLASEALSARGVPGHRFLDNASRGKGDGTYNYVIYDDSAIELLNPPDIDAMIARNREDHATHTAFEIVGGTGAVASTLFTARLSALPLDAQQRITSDIGTLAWQIATKYGGGVPMLSFSDGTGAWLTNLSPSMVGDADVTVEEMTATAAALGWLLEQDAVLVHRLRPVTSAEPEAYALDIFARQGEGRESLNDLFQDLRLDGPMDGDETLIKGFAPITDAAGRPGIRILLFDAGAEKTAAFRAYVDGGPGETIIGDHDAVLSEADVNLIWADWTKEEDHTRYPRTLKGDEYAAAYREATGRDFPSELLDAKTDLQEAFRLALEAEEAQQAIGQGVSPLEYRAHVLAANAGTQPPLGADGKVHLNHGSFGWKMLDVLDPSFNLSGKGITGGATKYRDVERSLDRGAVWFYTEGYNGDGAARSRRYEVVVPPGVLYNLSDDVLGLYDKVPNSALGNLRVVETMNLARQAGYLGTYSPGIKVVNVFEPVAPDRVYDRGRDGTESLVFERVQAYPEDNGVDAMAAYSPVVHPENSEGQYAFAYIGEETDAAFKNWYGNGWRIANGEYVPGRDMEGEPIRAWHGTEKGGFRVFDTDGNWKTHGTGAWFASEEANARTYSGRGADMFSMPRVDTIVDAKLWFTDQYGDEVRFEFHVEERGYKLHNRDNPTVTESVDVFTRDEAIEFVEDAFAADFGEGQSLVYEVFLRMENPVVIEWEGHHWNDSPPTEVMLMDATGDAVDWLYREDGETIEDVMSRGQAWVDEQRLEWQANAADIFVDVLEKLDPDLSGLFVGVDLDAVRFAIAHRTSKSLRDLMPMQAGETAEAFDARVEEAAEMLDDALEALGYLGPNFSLGATLVDHPGQIILDEIGDYDTIDAYANDGGQTSDQMVRDIFEMNDETDGVILKNIVDPGPYGYGFDDTPTTSYVVRTPDQIKSATDNSGRYDPNDPDILAAMPQQGTTSAGRERYAFESQRPDTGIAETDQNAEPVSLKGIADAFGRVIDATFRLGRITLGREAMGQWDRRTAVARIRFPGDLQTMVHEGGHALHDRMASPLQAVLDQHRKEVFAVARFYGDGLDGAPAQKKMREGFAEFFRLYVLERDAAVTHAPTLVPAFEAMLQQNDPDLLANLQDIGTMYRAFLEQSSLSLLRSMIAETRHPGRVATMWDELSELGAADYAKAHLTEMVQHNIDGGLLLRQLVARLLRDTRAKGAPVDLKMADDPAVLWEMASRSSQRALVQSMEGVMEYHGLEPTTGSLRDVLYLIHGEDPQTGTLRRLDKDRMEAFGGYVVALRALDEYRMIHDGTSRLKRPPINAKEGDLRRAVAEAEAKYGEAFRQAAQIMHEYGMALLKKQYDAGIQLTEAEYQRQLQRQFYVPLQRDLDRVGGRLGAAVSSSKGFDRVARAMHRLKGSDRDVFDPISVLMQKTVALEEIIARNDVALSLAKLATHTGQAGAVVEHVPAYAARVTEVDLKQVAARLTGLPGMSDVDANDVLTLIQPYLDQNTKLALFGIEVASTMGENITFYWDAGKLKAIQLEDGETGMDIVNLIDAVGHEALDARLEWLAASATMFRTGITSAPDFLISNFIRDQLTAWMSTDVGYIPFVTGLQGVAQELSQSVWARNYNAAMGLMGGMNSAALHRARVDRDVRALLGKGYVTKVFEPGLKGALQGILRITEMTETGTRLGLFKKGFERGKADGLTDWEAAIEAAFTGSDYANFGLAGDRMQTARRLIPFLNAQIQGMYKMWRVLGATEVARSHGFKTVLQAYFKGTAGMTLTRVEQGQIAMGRKAWIKMMSLALISAAMHYLFEDDEDYQQASEYLRATHWVFPVGDEMVAIPKPFEWALFANLVERGLEGAGGDTAAKDRFMRGAMMNLAPPYMPPLIGATMEHRFNWSLFRDAPLVPEYDIAAASRDNMAATNAYTSLLAKQIGEATGWKPMIVEHYLTSLGGSVARDLMNLSNFADPNHPAIPMTRWPVMRRFYRENTAGNTAGRDFWAHMGYREGTLTSAALAYKAAIERGDPVRAEALLQEFTDEEKAFVILSDTESFSADERRLHPMKRAQDISGITGAMSRDLVSAIGLLDTSNPRAPLATITLTAKQKAEVLDYLRNYTAREQRNALITIGAEGWTHREYSDTRTTLAMLRDIAPEVADELERRLAKAKVFREDVVHREWDDVRDRLLYDREQARLADKVRYAARR